MKVQQQKCDMKTYKVDIAKTKTNPGVGLPYSIVAQIVPVDETSTRFGADPMFGSNADIVKQFRKDLSTRYEQKDISCHIDNYTRVATINFRKEKDCADFLMRN